MPDDLDKTFLKSEQKIFTWLQKSSENHQKSLQNFQQAEIDKILMKYRRKFYFPELLEPPKPIEVYKFQLEREGSYYTESQLEKKWNSLEPKKREKLIQKLSPEISAHAKRVELAAVRAIHEKCWFALKEEEVILYGSKQDLAEHEKAWAGGEHQDILDVIENTSISKFEWQLLPNSEKQNEQSLLH